LLFSQVFPQVLIIPGTPYLIMVGLDSSAGVLAAERMSQFLKPQDESLELSPVQFLPCPGLILAIENREISMVSLESHTSSLKIPA